MRHPNTISPKVIFALIVVLSPVPPSALHFSNTPPEIQRSWQPRKRAGTMCASADYRLPYDDHLRTLGSSSRFFKLANQSEGRSNSECRALSQLRVRSVLEPRAAPHYRGARQIVLGQTSRHELSAANNGVSALTTFHMRSAKLSRSNKTF